MSLCWEMYWGIFLGASGNELKEKGVTLGRVCESCKTDEPQTYTPETNSTLQVNNKEREREREGGYQDQSGKVM